MASDRLGTMSRKDKSGTVTSSRIAAAVILGITLGTLLAFVRPHVFSASVASVADRTSSILPGARRFSLSTVSAVFLPRVLRSVLF